jgi:hypothetical protein
MKMAKGSFVETITCGWNDHGSLSLLSQSYYHSFLKRFSLSHSYHALLSFILSQQFRWTYETEVGT